MGKKPAGRRTIGGDAACDPAGDGFACASSRAGSVATRRATVARPAKPLDAGPETDVDRLVEVG